MKMVALLPLLTHLMSSLLLIPLLNQKVISLSSKIKIIMVMLKTLQVINRLLPTMAITFIKEFGAMIGTS